MRTARILVANDKDAHAPGRKTFIRVARRAAGRWLAVHARMMSCWLSAGHDAVDGTRIFREVKQAIR